MGERESISYDPATEGLALGDTWDADYKPACSECGSTYLVSDTETVCCREDDPRDHWPSLLNRPRANAYSPGLVMACAIAFAEGAAEARTYLDNLPGAGGPF